MRRRTYCTGPFRPIPSAHNLCVYAASRVQWLQNHCSTSGRPPPSVLTLQLATALPLESAMMQNLGQPKSEHHWFVENSFAQFMTHALGPLTLARRGMICSLGALSHVMPVPFLPSFQTPFISGMKDCRCKCSLAARREKVDGAPTKSGEAAIISRSLVALSVGAAGPMIEGTASTSIICTWALRTIEPTLVASKSRYQRQASFQRTRGSRLLLMP